MLANRGKSPDIRSTFSEPNSDFCREKIYEDQNKFFHQIMAVSRGCIYGGIGQKTDCDSGWISSPNTSVWNFENCSYSYSYFRTGLFFTSYSYSYLPYFFSRTRTRTCLIFFLVLVLVLANFFFSYSYSYSYTGTSTSTSTNFGTSFQTLLTTCKPIPSERPSMFLGLEKSLRISETKDF